ncbi:MAG: hypothetical protein ACOC80_09010 [Petrotogales bacterium]
MIKIFKKLISKTIKVNSLYALCNEIEKRHNAYIRITLNIDNPYHCDGELDMYRPITIIEADTKTGTKIICELVHDINGTRNSVVLSHLATAIHISTHELKKYITIIKDNNDNTIVDIHQYPSNQYLGLIKKSRNSKIASY